MGGPALHVAYLTEGLRKRGYETTLVAGSLARGEDSMAFVADARRRRGRAHRRARPRDLAAAGPRRDDPARAADPKGAAADPAHAHGEGRDGRSGRCAARRLAAAADRRPHLPRPRAPRVLRPGPHARPSGCSSAGSPLGTTALIAVSPQVRDDLVAPGRRAARALRRHSARHRARRARRPGTGTAAARAAAISASPTTASPSAGSAA